MRWPLILLIFISSCKSLTEQEKLQQTLTGKWLMVGPEPVVKNNARKMLYKRIQDSLIDLRGLKLLLLTEDGGFQQMDSLEMKGKWQITPDKVLRIEGGGAGFENYSVNFTDFNDGTLTLTGFIQAEGESIKLKWTLKKLSGSNASSLFSAGKNEWRKRPAQPESATQMKKRLSEMLKYYADYYTLLRKEITFFLPSRVIIPFQFYQHAMGLRPLYGESPFVKLFFNHEQAEEAYSYLEKTLTSLKDDFPSRSDSYLKEYSAFMEQMAERVKSLEL